MILHGDNLTIMPTFPDKSIDLTVTSPPYDNLRTYNGNSQFDFEGIAKELFRVTKDGGVVVWVAGDATANFGESLTSFKQAIFFVDVAGFKLLDTMIYRKRGMEFPRFNHRNYPQVFEFMFIFTKGRPRIFNPISDRPNIAVGKKYSSTIRCPDGSMKRSHSYDRRSPEIGMRGNIWEYAVGNNLSNQEPIVRQHPAIFPLQLATDHILSWSNEGDTVLDPFAGSGTTGVACLNTGRKFILIEKDAGYCEIIRKRIANHEPLLQAVTA